MSVFMILLGLVSSGQAAPPGDATGPFPPLERARALRLELGGIARRYLDAVTTSWLLPAPEANPAMLAMFADRDRPPYRDLLPWSGEFAGKYLTGATQVMNTTGDPRLRRHLERFVAELLTHQDADGYLGPFPRGHRLTGSAPNIQGKPGGTWDAWGHYHMMLGLLIWHQATEDPAALAAACRIGDLLCARFLGDKHPRLVDTGSTEMNLAPAHALCLLFRKTGEKRYLDLAEQIVREFAAVDTSGKPLAGDYFRRGLAGDDFYRLPKPRWESLHPVLCLPELARIFGNGNGEYGKAFANLWWSIARLDRHNNGGFSSGEQAQGNPYHPGAIETCCTIAWMAMTVEMLRLSGDPLAADELELSTFNSAMGLFSPTGRWSTYNTPMDGARKANFHDIVFQSRPGSPELNCCSVNAARGLGLLSEWALMHDAKNDAVVLNWYGPGQLSAQLASGTAVSLTVDTDYPRSGRVRIKVDPDRPSRFSLRLRVPHWSNLTSIQVDNEPARKVNPGTYLDLARDWKPGDVVTLILDVAFHLWAGERECAGRASLYRGPILLAYDPRFNPDMPDDPPPFDASHDEPSLSEQRGPQPPLVLVKLGTASRPIFLCDFASAGVDGSSYRSWLRALHATPLDFTRDHPWRSRPLVRGQAAD
jgi:DUF1680 family protein